MRDVLIGSVPPAAIGDWRYLMAALLAGLLIFLWFPRYLQSSKVQHLILMFDAAGLGLFAVTGTQKALGYGLNPIMVPLLGMLSGIGGGILRDVLVAEIPTVLRSNLYAVAALAGEVIQCVSSRAACTQRPAIIVRHTVKLSSNTTISASLPAARLPLRSSTPITRAGVRLAIRTASASGIPTASRRIGTIWPSRVVLPAKAL